MKLSDFAKLVKKFADDDNAKDGVRAIYKPNHAFECLKCGRIYTFKFDAMHCRHGKDSPTDGGAVR